MLDPPHTLHMMSCRLRSQKLVLSGLHPVHVVHIYHLARCSSRRSPGARALPSRMLTARKSVQSDAVAHWAKPEIHDPLMMMIPLMDLWRPLKMTEALIPTRILATQQSSPTYSPASPGKNAGQHVPCLELDDFNRRKALLSCPNSSKVDLLNQQVRVKSTRERVLWGSVSLSEDQRIAGHPSRHEGGSARDSS